MFLQEATKSWIEQEILSKGWRTPKILIALSARRCSGKTTAGRILQTELGFEVMAFADAAKQAYADYAGFPVSELYDPETKEKRRPGLIAYCDGELERDSDVFVKKWCERLCCPENLACDDPRLPQEKEAFELLGAKFIRIKASFEVRTAMGYVPDGAIDNHPTETYMESLPDEFFLSSGGIVDNRGPGYYDSFQDDILALVGGLMGMRLRLG